MSRTYSLFISHSWTYGDSYDSLVRLLNSRYGFQYRNYSVPKDDPIHDAPNASALYQAIKDQISPCCVVLILAGKYATYSKWINNEIRIAKKEFSTPKPILAIAPWASLQISDVVRKNADMIVRWNTDSIIAGIRQLAC